jgi:hypothetical protein
MQLPRGTFREIKKSEQVSSILDEFEQKKFSGICNISSDKVSGTLVFKSGKCILAKVQSKSGDTAWDELLKMNSQEVDAALSSLDEAQIQLALEFNKVCRIVKGGKTIPVTGSLPQKSVSLPHPEPDMKKIPLQKNPGAPTKPEAGLPKHIHPAPPTPRPSSSFVSPPLSVKNASPPPQARASVPSQPPSMVQPQSQIPVSRPSPSIEQNNSPESEEMTAKDSSCFERDIDTFDTLDLDDVTDKIRNDCKTMIKQLQLEHLMER